jgi:AcrR family transcriptional regulator
MPMGREPKARGKILESARRIVQTRGAGALTFEELVKDSGITRGGITYHFPTKEALLRGLLESDLAQWSEAEQAQAPTDCDPDTARLIGFIRAFTAPDDDRRRFLCGMLSAATLEPSLMDPCREELRSRLGRVSWSDRDLRMHLLQLAVEGLVWQELLQVFSMPAPARRRLVELMEQLAREWGRQRKTDAA